MHWSTVEQQNENAVENYKNFKGEKVVLFKFASKQYQDSNLLLSLVS